MSVPNLRFPNLIRVGALWAIVVGVWVIIGWILGMDVMKTSIKDGSSMKFNTAICSILCGITILCHSFSFTNIIKVCRILPWIVALISGLTLMETYFEVNFGIDELVFTDYTSRLKGLPYPGRTSTALALCFFVMGLGLSLFESSVLWKRKLAQWSFHAVSVFSMIFIISYLYKVPYLSSKLIIGSMTLHSSVLMFSLSIICALFNENLAFTGLFLKDKSGSKLARQLFPGLMLLVILIGLFRASTLSQSIIGFEFGIALFSIGFMIIGLLILSISSYYLNQMEEKKRFGGIQPNSIKPGFGRNHKKANI